MGEVQTYWLSTKRMTVGVDVKDGIVVDGPPIVRKFIGQPAKKLGRWLRKQPGFKYRRVNPPEEGPV